jgi:hypothetical protein
MTDQTFSLSENGWNVPFICTYLCLILFVNLTKTTNLINLKGQDYKSAKLIKVTLSGLCLEVFEDRSVPLCLQVFDLKTQDRKITDF